MCSALASRLDAFESVGRPNCSAAFSPSASIGMYECEAAPGSRAAELASIRYAERRALESAARWFDAQLELPASSVEYYQERRLRSLNLDPIETAEDLDALRAAGRAYSDNDW